LYWVLLLFFFPLLLCIYTSGFALCKTLSFYQIHSLLLCLLSSLITFSLYLFLCSLTCLRLGFLCLLASWFSLPPLPSPHHWRRRFRVLLLAPLIVLQTTVEPIHKLQQNNFIKLKHSHSGCSKKIKQKRKRK